jgi:hypothetical protein
MNNSGIYNNADRMKNWYCINNLFKEEISMILTKTPGGIYDENDYWTVPYMTFDQTIPMIKNQWQFFI